MRIRCCHRYVMDVIHVFPEIRGVPSLMRISVERCTSQKFNLDTKNGHLQSRRLLFQGLIILGINVGFPGVYIVIPLTGRFPRLTHHGPETIRPPLVRPCHQNPKKGWEGAKHVSADLGTGKIQICRESGDIQVF